MNTRYGQIDGCLGRKVQMCVGVCVCPVSWLSLACGQVCSFKCVVRRFPWHSWLASLDDVPHTFDVHQPAGHFKMASNEDATTAAGATMIALSVIVVACRFYMRLKLKSGLKWDDWFILISLLSLITAGVLVVAGMSCLLSFPFVILTTSLRQVAPS